LTMGEVIKRQKRGKFIGWYIRYYDADGKRCIKASKQPTYNEARRMLWVPETLAGEFQKFCPVGSCLLELFRVV
jgi:hypothetical protein